MLAPTFTTPLGPDYRAPGGPWAGPSLDALLTTVAAPDSAARVARLAGGLRAQGVRPGDAVAWRSANRTEVDLCYRACWRLGAVAVPLHHLAGEAEVARLVAATAPAVVLDDLDHLPDGDPVTEPWADNEALAAVLFTSGSSGDPKGVLHTQATLACKAVQMRTAHGLGPDDCVLMPAPAAHISGLLNGVTLPGIVPFRTVFMARWDPAAALEIIERERVTFMVGPPTFFVGLMEAPGFSPEQVASLRLISSGGAGVSEAFVAEAERVLSARVKRTYGSTEAPTVISDGRPIGSVGIDFADDGELLVRGPEVCVGYLDPAATAEAFTADGWFRTGDLARRDPDGTIALVGRKKDIVIRGGENISTAEVEAVLEAHPGVRQAVAVGIPDDRLGERVCAFVVGDPAFDLEACREWFAARGVARYKTPERVIRIDAVPVLASGKPDRASLRDRASD